MGWNSKMKKNTKKLLLQLDSSNSYKTQEKAMEQLKSERDLNIFILPGEPFSKGTWENCAKILYMKTDNELLPYVEKLMDWLEDMNWPGAWIILERLSLMPKEFIKKAYFEKRKIAYKEIEKVGEDYLNSWYSNLEMIFFTEKIKLYSPKNQK